MNKYLWATASAMLTRFEGAPTLHGDEADQLVQAILRACGYDVRETGFVENHDEGIDCYFLATLEGKLQRVGVEIKYGTRPVQSPGVTRALTIAKGGLFDRSWIIARAGFSDTALRLAETHGPGMIDLLGPEDLRSWVTNSIAGRSEETGSVSIIRTAMRELANRIAKFPQELQTVEWRDLERILREVFEGIGFETHLTRSGKDGGFDLELSASTLHGRKTYLVEVKHWTAQRPGAAHLTKLVRISIEREVDGALLLSTSGFSRSIHAGLLEFSPPVRLGSGDKVIGLCKAYSRISTGYWLQEDLQSTLFRDTELVTGPNLPIQANLP